MKRNIGEVIILLVFLCLLQAGLGFAQDFYTQIDSYILKSLDENKRATRFSEWLQSGFTAEDLYQNVNAFSSEEYKTKFCESVIALEAEDYLLFETVIKKIPNCALKAEKTLAKKIKHFDVKTHAQIKAFEKVLKKSAHKTPIQESALDENEFTLVFIGEFQPEDLLELAKFLQKKSVSAHIFEYGKTLRENISLYAQLKKYDQHLGHTSFEAHWLRPTNPRLVRREIQASKRAVGDVIITPSPLFFFPSDEAHPQLFEHVYAEKLIPILSSVDAMDWKVRNPEKISEYLVRKFKEKKKGIFVFHGAQSHTLFALETFLNALADTKAKNAVFIQNDRDIATTASEPKD